MISHDGSAGYVTRTDYDMRDEHSEPTPAARKHQGDLDPGSELSTDTSERCSAQGLWRNVRRAHHGD